MYKLLLNIFLAFFSFLPVFGVEKTNAFEKLQAKPSFSTFENNYFISGIPTNQAPTRNNSDIKFQISVAQRVNNKIMADNMFFYLTYTQKSFWNAYQESSPFSDNNYNPAIVFRNYFLIKGKTAFAGLNLEHESNGLSGNNSRAWSFFLIEGNIEYSSQLLFDINFWIPFSIAEENSDMLDYKGIGNVKLTYATKDRRLGTSFMLNPRKGLGNMNFSVEIFGRFKKWNNPYVFLQYYNGYDESMLYYNHYVSMLRIGFVLKSQY